MSESENLLTFENLDLPGCQRYPLSIPILRRFLTLMLQHHYSDPANYGYLRPFLNCLTWSPNKNESGLSITPDFSDDTINDTAATGIYIGLSDMNFKPSAVARSDEDDTLGAASDSTWIITVQVQITHVAPTYDQAYLLAESSAIFLLGTWVTTHNILKSFVPQQISKPAMVKKDPLSYKCLLVGTIFGEFTVTSTLESLRLKKTVLEIAEE